MNWETLKEKMGINLGYGALREEDTVNEISGTVVPKSKFDRAVSHVVTGLLIQLIVPWIEYCFHKYSEAHFHQRMLEGFNFIQDMKDNHIDRYNYILRAIRKVRNRISLNNEKILEIVLKECKKRGWTITEWEKQRFREDIATLIAEIYQ